MEVGLCSNAGQTSLLLCFKRLSEICNCSKTWRQKCKIFGELNQKWWCTQL
jgi:hypothetical protein